MYQNQQEYFNLFKTTLAKLITNDYILLDLPYFTNVGDILIWQSTLDILETLPYKCLYSCSKESYIKPSLPADAIIIFMGGGNFGDLWKSHQVFRHRVLTDFPNNRILQLPQSVWFKSKEDIKQDAAIFSKHIGDITICLREQQSYDLIKSNYKSVNVLLLPDLVLSFDVNKYIKKYNIHIQEKKETVFIKRQDIEKKDNNSSLYMTNVEIADWPCMQKKTVPTRVIEIIIRIIHLMHLPANMRKRLLDFCYKHILKDIYLKVGIKFIGQYKNVYSTRLHAAILSCLLGKKTYLFDNSYGKCSGVFYLWMKNYSNIKMMQ